MSVPQGICTYPGVGQVVRASFTLSHGITPSSGVIEMAPQESLVAQVGTLAFRFGGVLIQFPGCRLASPTFTRSGQGILASFQVQDRRWAWEFGSVSGRYNVRREDGSVDRSTERTPQQLATLLFQAMGESGFAVGELPNETRPEVDWDYANPAQELADLCESLGCRVVLGLNNRVSLRRTGQGAPLPNLGIQMTEGYGATIQARPDALLFVAGPTLYEVRLRLEAVGLDTDGTVKPIDELSYKPSTANGGWSKQNPNVFSSLTNTLSNGQTSDESRMLALQSVFRWYRVTAETSGNVLPDFSSLWQVLPLAEGRLKDYAGDDGTVQFLPPLVSGIYWQDGAELRSTDNVSGGGRKSRVYTGRFDVDRENGIVKTDDPVYQLSSTDNTISEAELYLTIAVPFRDSTTRAPERFTHRVRLPGRSFGTGPRVVMRDDVRRQVRANYGFAETLTGLTDNQETVRREAEFALNAAMAEYVSRPTFDIQYAGLLPIAPDGAIQQVTWNVGPDGATTRASRNTEANLSVPSYKERRRIERQKAAVSNAQKVAKAVFGFLRSKK